MRARHWSLRYKFLAITVVVLAVAVLSYLALAVSLFNRDKTAYIYDNNAALVETLAEEATTGLTSALKTMRLAGLAFERDAATVESLVRDDDNFVELAIHRLSAIGAGGTAPALRIVNEAFLKAEGLEPAFLDEVAAQRPWPLTALIDKAAVFRNHYVGKGVPLLGVAVAMTGASGDSLVVTANLRQDRRFQMFQRSSVYTTYLVDGAGRILAHTDPTVVLRGDELAQATPLRALLDRGLAKGAQEVVGSDGARHIVAFKRLGLGGLAAISEIPAEKAFDASRRLVEKSALFAVLIMALAFLVSILSTRRLTNALRALYQATQTIAQGDFKINVDVRTDDEVGALSDSMNRMAREIDRLVAETADKARMEKELETAQLVQDNFFPAERLAVGAFDVSAYFKPASECGGDWWGSFRMGEQLVLLIGDATGHGVPAALITAAAHSCATTLAHLSQRLGNLPVSPAFIMDNLNAAICHAGKGKVKMTFFVAAIDLPTGRVRYCNASHAMPLVCRDPERREAGARATRADLDTLDGAPDPCLGEALETRFREYEAAIEAGDAVVWYTDGLVECRNTGGDEFGEGRLTRGFLEAAALDAEGIRGRLVTKAQEFYGRPEQDDDITLVVVKRRKDAAFARRAG